MRLQYHHIYYCICTHRTPITRSNLSTHAATQTYALFVQGQHETHHIHSTNDDQRRAVIAIVRSVFGQQNGACMRVTLPGMHCDLILHQTLITNTFKFKHIQQYKRTSCWFRANTTSVPCIQQTKINAEPSLPS